jgi:hypothetical protein
MTALLHMPRLRARQIAHKLSPDAGNTLRSTFAYQPRLVGLGGVQLAGAFLTRDVMIKLNHKIAC